VRGGRGHTKEKCWKVIGYPSWHPRGKKNPQKKGGANRQGQLNSSFGGKTQGQGFKIANQAKLAEKSVLGLTAQQIKQLLKLLPASSTSSSISHSEDIDEEIDCNFVGIAICFNAEQGTIN